MNRLKISKKTLFKYENYLHLLNVDYHDEMTNKQLLIKLDMWYDFKFLEFKQDANVLTLYKAQFTTYTGIEGTIQARKKEGVEPTPYIKYDDITYFYCLTIDTPHTYLITKHT